MNDDEAYRAGFAAGWQAREIAETGGWIPALPDAIELRTARTELCRPYGLRGRPMFGEHLGRKR